MLKTFLICFCSDTECSQYCFSNSFSFYFNTIEHKNIHKQNKTKIIVLNPYLAHPSVFIVHLIQNAIDSTKLVFNYLFHSFTSCAYLYKMQFPRILFSAFSNHSSVSNLMFLTMSYWKLVKIIDK